MPRILLEGLKGVEAHRLVVHEGDGELQGVVALQPGRLVCGDCEGVGVGLGEHVVAVDLGEYPLGHIPGNTPALRPFQEPLPVHSDEVLAVGSGEGPPYLIGLGSREPRHVHDELDHLLLPDDDAVAPL